MAMLFANNASTTISGSITPASTTVQLAAGTGAKFPNPTGGNYYSATFYDQATKSTYEIVHVTAMSGDIATIVRGQEGTTPANWTSGDIFANLVTAGTLNNFVQAGTGPADTSILYVGTDTSVTPNLIVATTNPVPAAYAVGMTFVIKVANTNTGPTNVQLNGLASKPALRTDGSALVGGNLTAGQEAIFMWNGTAFDTTRPPIPAQPPQTVFYVNPSGNDNNSGFSPATTDAFASVQGAINAIKSRYISSNTITIRVADGVYTSGWQDTSSYIAAWDIIGNEANPGNVSIIATSTNSATYVPGAPYGLGCEASGTANMIVRGFSFQSYYYNIASGSTMHVQNCRVTAPVAGSSCIQATTGGTLTVSGNITFTGTGTAGALFQTSLGSAMAVGGHNIFGATPVTINIAGTPTFSGATCAADSSSALQLWMEDIVWTGNVPTGRKFVATTSGGVWTTTNNPSSIPGSQPGVYTTPGWVI